MLTVSVLTSLRFADGDLLSVASKRHLFTTFGILKFAEQWFNQLKKNMGNDKPTKRRKDSTSSESSVDSAENERRQDLKERDEFANRLRKKDESHTRKLVEVIISLFFQLF